MREFDPEGSNTYDEGFRGHSHSQRVSGGPGISSMRIAYLDCFSGISGDMFLGALIDAGVSPGLLRDTVRALNVGAELEFTKALRNGIAAMKVDVVVNGEKDLPREEFWAQQHEHAH